MRIALIFLLASAAYGQATLGAGSVLGGGSLIGGLAPGTIIIDGQFTMTSNSNGSYPNAIPALSITPVRKQLGNFGTGCDGSSGTILPLNVTGGTQNGQLYATTAIQTAAESASPTPCATQGVPTVTNSGTGIAATDNGKGAGGTDSATAFTDTYGDSTYDSYCTGDTHANDPSWITGLNFPGCTANSGSTFSSTSSVSFPNVSMLWPTAWPTNNPIVDLPTNWLDSWYWKIDSGALPRNMEVDVNINSSPTAYGMSQGGYYGAGLDYSYPASSWRACPQNCPAWINLKLCPVPSGSCITTWTPTAGDVYHSVLYGHRGVGGGFNNYCYDAMTLYDVTAAAAPVTYTITDTSNNLVCGVPANLPTFASGADTQAQIDQSSSGTATFHMDSRTTLFYHTVGNQFANLPTVSTDYTCVGIVPCSTWPMVAMPAPGGSFSDPVYNTTTWRLPVTTGTSSNLMPTYSRVQAWNSANTKMMVTVLPTAGGVTTALYDATQTPPAFINIITPSDGFAIDGADNDALWAYTDPNRIYYNLGTNTSHGLELRYIDISSCTTLSCSPTPVIVHTFSCTTDSTSILGAGVAGNKFETGSGAQGGMFDSTDTYFMGTCDKVDTNGRHVIDLISYNRNTNTVTTQEKWYNVCPGAVPTGCYTYNHLNSPPSEANLMRENLHPDGNYWTIIWQSGARDATWVRGEGVEAYDRSFNYLGVVSPYDGHQDMGYDVNGVPVWVGVASFRNDTIDDRALSITNLTTLSTTAQTYRRVLLPCSYNRSGPGCNTGTDLTAKSTASHISMTGTIGSFKGYGLFSTMILAGQYRPQLPDWPTGTTLGTTVTPGTVTVTPASMADIGVGVVSTVGTGTGMESVTWTSVTGTTATATFTKSHATTDTVRCLSCGDTGFAAFENLVVKIDSNALDGSNVSYYRAGRTMAIRDNNYNSEPHTTINRDFTQMLFGSSWNVDCNSNLCVNAYWMKLP